MSFDEMKEMLANAGRDVTEANLVDLGNFVIDAVENRQFIIGRNLDDTVALLHRRADAIGRFEVPPHHGMPI